MTSRDDGKLSSKSAYITDGEDVDILQEPQKGVELLDYSRMISAIAVAALRRSTESSFLGEITSKGLCSFFGLSLFDL